MIPGQKPLEHMIAAIAGLSAIHPDPTVNSAAELINQSLAEMLRQILGDERAEAIFEAAIAGVAPVLEKEFGIQIVSARNLEKQAKTETDDLLTKLRKGGL